MKTGTLKELNVKPGDVVEMIEGDFVGDKGCVTDNGDVVCFDGSGVHGEDEDGYYERKWRIIPRASVIDDTPKTWGEMTDAEKGALLLAEHEGKVIEEMTQEKTHPHDVSGQWLHWTGDFRPQGNIAYRIRPEPKRETVTLYGWATNLGSQDGWAFSGDSALVRANTQDTHRITFDLIDGKPDCASVKMEEV